MRCQTATLQSRTGNCLKSCGSTPRLDSLLLTKRALSFPPTHASVNCSDMQKPNSQTQGEGSTSSRPSTPPTDLQPRRQVNELLEIRGRVLEWSAPKSGKRVVQRGYSFLLVPSKELEMRECKPCASRPSRWMSGLSGLKRTAAMLIFVLLSVCATCGELTKRVASLVGSWFSH